MTEVLKTKLNNLEVSRNKKLKHIGEIAEGMGLIEDEVEFYGKYKAKISLSVLERLKNKPDGKYIDITAITPTPLGEGKTVTTIGLALALNKIGKKAIVNIRQPSMGPTFGIKGGAAGGGHSQIIPMEEFNLHLTGDIHAVSIAHNLLAAVIDNYLQKEGEIHLDPFSITWKRVVDVSDRALRNIVIGLGGKSTGGVPRETGFDISVASELMSVLSLSLNLSDMRKKLGKIIIGYTNTGDPVTAEDLKSAGAMAVLLKDAIKPNLMQTSENTPCLVHTGPFGNISTGNSSIIADYIGLKCADYVVTESGFGADMGAEKFFNIKCRYSGLKPDAMVLVATVRALKMHSGRYKVVPGKPLDKGLKEENLEAIKLGAGNLIKQIENVKMHNVPVVVAINRFDSDTENELNLIRKIALENRAEDAVISEVWAKGGEGGVVLAEAVIKATEKSNEFRFLYPLNISIKEKISILATEIYGASDVDYDKKAEKDIDKINKMGLDNLPICMAKTQLSISHDPNWKGKPIGYRFPIKEVKIAAGAGYIYPVAGDILLMPGLPSNPAVYNIDLDEEGNIVGLF